VRRNINQNSEKFGIKNLCSGTCVKYHLDRIIAPEGEALIIYILRIGVILPKILRRKKQKPSLIVESGTPNFYICS
jgi:hypothetical protein